MYAEEHHDKSTFCNEERGSLFAKAAKEVCVGFSSDQSDSESYRSACSTLPEGSGSYEEIRGRPKKQQRTDINTRDQLLRMSNHCPASSVTHASKTRVSMLLYIWREKESSRAFMLR